MTTDLPLIPGLTEVVEAPVTHEEWRQQNGTVTPVGSMTTIHLMHLIAWMERNAKNLQDQADLSLMRLALSAGHMSDGVADMFDQASAEQAEPLTWLHDTLVKLADGRRNLLEINWLGDNWDDPTTIDLTRNEWAIRPLAIMRGLVASMSYQEMHEWVEAS
jgi:hypothetical protein